MDFRKSHNKIAPIIFVPLLLAALSGIAYRVGRSWFGLSDDFGDFMMVIHEGRFLGRPLVPVYVMLVGFGLIAMVITGVRMLLKRRNHGRTEPKLSRFNPRLVHGFLAPFFFLPFLVSAATGLVYRLGKAWFGLSSEQAKIFLQIHQASYLGRELRVLYVLIVGLGLVAFLLTGIQMTGILKKRSVA
jgi:uncharacterized iron-regulated membrane protein